MPKSVSPLDERLVQARVALAHGIQARRKAKRMTQTALAEAMQSTQARVAKIEAASREVSLDLMLRAMFALDSSLSDVGVTLCRHSSNRGKFSI